jgi:hypothetical protein
MNRSSTLCWLLLCAPLLATGCGESPTSPVRRDAGFVPDVFVVPPDSSVTTLQDYQACQSTSQCPTNDDCVPIGWFSNLSACLPRCSTQTTCGLDNVCYPSGLTGPLAAMSGHCYVSRCGTGLKNGHVNSTCNLGDDLSLGLSRPGSCVPYSDSDPTGAAVPFGYCLDAGPVTDDSRCDFATRTAGGLNCVAGDRCIGQAGASAGVCEPMCDPSLQTSPTQGPCTGGKACEDISLAFRFPDASGVGSITVTQGFCSMAAWCDIYNPTTCPPDTDLMPAAPTQCFASNPVYAHGVCVVPTSGTVGATPTGSPCTLSQECVPGDKCSLTTLPAGAPAACITPIPACAPASCLQMCDPTAAASSPGACPAGQTCQTDIDTPGNAAAGSCDGYTVHWGVCR